MFLRQDFCFLATSLIKVRSYIHNLLEDDAPVEYSTLRVFRVDIIQVRKGFPRAKSETSGLNK